MIAVQRGVRDAHPQLIAFGLAVGGGARGEFVAYHEPVGCVGYHQVERRIHSIDDEIVENATVAIHYQGVTGTPDGHRRGCVDEAGIQTLSGKRALHLNLCHVGEVKDSCALANRPMFFTI